MPFASPEGRREEALLPEGVPLPRTGLHQVLSKWAWLVVTGAGPVGGSPRKAGPVSAAPSGRGSICSELAFPRGMSQPDPGLAGAEEAGAQAQTTDPTGPAPSPQGESL